MKKTNRILVSFLLVFTLCMLTACGNNNNAADEVPNGVTDDNMDDVGDGTDADDGLADDGTGTIDGTVEDGTAGEVNDGSTGDAVGNGAGTSDNAADGTVGDDAGVNENSMDNGTAGDGTVSGAVGDGVEDLGEGVADGVRGIGNGIGDAVEDVGDAVGDAANGR